MTRKEFISKMGFGALVPFAFPDVGLRQESYKKYIGSYYSRDKDGREWVFTQERFDLGFQRSYFIFSANQIDENIQFVLTKNHFGLDGFTKIIKKEHWDKAPNGLKAIALCAYVLEANQRIFV